MQNLQKSTSVLIVLIFYVIHYSLGLAADAPAYLDPDKLPPNVKQQAAHSFDSLKDHEVSDWTQNGCEEEAYGLARVSEYGSVKAMIQENPELKQIHVVDPGAANMGWTKGLARFLDSDQNIRSDVIVYIWGFRGEKCKASIQVGRNYKRYEVGNFKLEDFKQEWQRVLKDNGFSPDTKCHLFAASYTLQHLVAPVITLINFLNCAEPKIGTILTDGFALKFEGQTDTSLDFSELRQNMAILLQDMGEPFLIEPYSHDKAINRYVIRRTHEGDLRLPWAYGTLKKVPDNSSFGSDMGSKHYCTYKRMVPSKPLELDPSHDVLKGHADHATHYGNSKGKELFDWISDHKLWVGNPDISSGDITYAYTSMEYKLLDS